MKLQLWQKILCISQSLIKQSLQEILMNIWIYQQKNTTTTTNNNNNTFAVYFKDWKIFSEPY